MTKPRKPKQASPTEALLLKEGMKLAARFEQLAGVTDEEEFGEGFSALRDQAMIWGEAHIKWAGKFLPKQEAKDVQ